MKRGYIVIIIVILFLGWLLYKMTRTPEDTGAQLEEYINTAKQITDQSDQINKEQQQLLANYKNGNINAEEAKTLNQNYLNQQQELLNQLDAIEAPEEIATGPAVTLRESLAERVEAAKKTLDYIETGDEQVFNKAKEHLIRSSGGVMSAYRRIDDYK